MPIELNRNFKVNPEFANLIPPLTHKEELFLEESLKKEGCREALVIWNGTLIDGHNRYKFCTANNISFQVIEKHFADEDEAKLWMIDNQMGRRNLNATGMLVLERGRQEILAKQADKRMKTGKKIDPDHNYGQGCNDMSGRTDRQIAEHSGISHNTISKFNYISKNAKDDDETIRMMCEGALDDEGKKMSIAREYNKLKWKERQEELRHKGFPLNKYRVIYADSKDLSFSQMKKYPVNEMAKTSSILFFWAFVPHLKESMDLLEHWGFEYATTLLWDFVKPCDWCCSVLTHEFLLVAHKGDWTGVVPENNGKLPSLFQKEMQGDIPSDSRPEEYKTMIHKLYPNDMKIDLFGSTPTDGWEIYNQEENAKHLWR